MHFNFYCVSIHCMTHFERTKQPIAVFENAGRIAFGMQIPIGNNPYPKTDTNGVAEPAESGVGSWLQSRSEEAFLKEHPARVERKPFKRTSTGPKFTPKVQPDKKKFQRPPANPPRWKNGARPEAGRAK